MPERHAHAPTTQLLPSATNACSTLGIRTRAADVAWSGFGPHAPGSFPGPPFAGGPGSSSRVREAGGTGNRLPHRPACAASSEDIFSALEGSGPVSSRGIAAAVPADDPSPDRFGAAGVNGRVPGPHSFEYGSARRRDCQPLTVRLQLMQNGRLAEGLSTVDSDAPTYANGRLTPPGGPGSLRWRRVHEVRQPAEAQALGADEGQQFFGKHPVAADSHAG